MVGEDALNTLLAETLKTMLQTMLEIKQKFLEVEKAVDTIQTTQVFVSQNVSTIQSRVHSLSAGNPLRVRRRMFNLPSSHAQNGTSRQITLDAANIVIQPEDGETQLGDDDQLTDQHEQESLDQFETMRRVSRELKEMRSTFHQATSSKPDIDRVIEETRQTPFTPQIASMRIRDSWKLNLEPYNRFENTKRDLATFLIAA